MMMMTARRCFPRSVALLWRKGDNDDEEQEAAVAAAAAEC